MSISPSSSDLSFLFSSFNFFFALKSFITLLLADITTISESTSDFGVIYKEESSNY